MAIEKEHKSEIENIISRLTAAGVQADEKKSRKYIQDSDYSLMTGSKQPEYS